MTPDLTPLRSGVQDLPSEVDKAKLLRDLDMLGRECQSTDALVRQMRAEEEEKNRQLKRKSLVAIPVFLAAAIGFAWYLTSALSDGYVNHRHQVISSAADPINFWFRLIWPAAGVVVCLVGAAYLFRFAFVSRRQTKQ